MAAQTSIKVTVQTGAAKDDVFDQGQVTEDSGPIALNVLANDPGSAKLWSVAQDPLPVNDQVTSYQLDSGATVSIVNGILYYDPSGSEKIQSLGSDGVFTDTFTYTVRMANGALSLATVTVTVGGENDAASISGVHGGEVVEDGEFVTGGTLKVSDVDTGENKFAAVDEATLQGEYGSFSFDSETGAWTYTLDNQKAQILKAAETVYEKLVVQSLDGTATETILVKVIGTNGAPVLTGSQALLEEGTEDTAYTIDKDALLAGFTDEDRDAMAVTNLTATHGKLLDNDDGTWTFTPDANYNGTIDLTYTVIDGQGGEAAATQSFNLAAVADDYSFNFSVVQTPGTSAGEPITFVPTSTTMKQSILNAEYGSWLKGLGHDTGEDGIVSYEWDQNQSVTPVKWVEGANLSFSNVTAITVGNNTRYIATVATPTDESTPDTVSVTAETPSQEIHNFDVGSDTLSFEGLEGLTREQIGTFFSQNVSDRDGDGVLDTTISLSNDSWSVTLLGVNGVDMHDLIA
jgi:VCBS repeat-containing protein